jgi:hypothetical protein
MRWRTERGGASKPVRDASAGSSGLARLQMPTNRLTAFQLFYILILNGVGAMMISAGINFAAAYGEFSPPSAPGNLSTPHKY